MSAPNENARFIAHAPELYDVANELFALLVAERECYIESNRNQATGELPSGCVAYVAVLDAALNWARFVFAQVEL